jgi:hypothetical protein
VKENKKAKSTGLELALAHSWSRILKICRRNGSAAINKGISETWLKEKRKGSEILSRPQFDGEKNVGMARALLM